MGFLDYIFGFSADAPSIFPHDESDERAWSSYSGNRDLWGGHSGPATTGGYINPDDAIGVSCVFLGLTIWANVLGTSPIRFYRNRPKAEGEDPLYDHPLLKVLSPDGIANTWMTAIYWRMWAEAQRHLWGLSVSEIKWGSDGIELWPIEAEHITQIDQLESGKIRFVVSEPGKQSRYLMQDQVLRLEGFGTHKVIPESLLRRCREAVAVWLAQQQYRGSYFERGASPSIIFKHPGAMSDQALKRFKTGVQGRIGGNRNAHKALVIEEGMDVKEFGHTARNAQLVEAWDAQANEVSRWMCIPPHMLGVSSASLPYNSRESASRDWLNLHARPRARMTEASIKRDLIVEKDVVCEIDLTQHERGDALAQAQVDAIYVMNGIRAENEVRRDNGWNPVPGLDTPERSVNQGKSGSGDQGGDPRQPRQDNAGDRQTMFQLPADSVMAGMVEAAETETTLPVVSDTMRKYLHDRHRRVLEASARQLLRRETEQVRRHAIQHASNPSAWSAWLSTFYQSHVVIMSDRLAVEVAQARKYSDRHQVEAEKEGVGVCDQWERDSSAINEMVELALGEVDK